MFVTIPLGLAFDIFTSPFSVYGYFKDGYEGKKEGEILNKILIDAESQRIEFKIEDHDRYIQLGNFVSESIALTFKK